MKQSVSGGGRGGGGKLRLPTEEEVEVAEILLTLPRIVAKSEILHRYSFAWGPKKKRSALISQTESSPSPLTLPLTKRPVVEKKLTAVEADKSPSTSLCFLPSGSGSDGGGENPKLKTKTTSSGKKKLKRKLMDDLMELYNKKLQEKENLLREKEAMNARYQKLTSKNLKLKAIMQQVNYSKDYQQPQITMFAPPPEHCQQVVAVHGGGRFGMFNQIDPRVKILEGESYEYVVGSQPLDRSRYLMMDDDQRVRAAAANRKKRIMRMKENKNTMLGLKLASRACR
ncbi:hypothetical protein SSX86_017784 [Deinandra increscens subsp. villosa]|uniref:Uncharacterized protein n=1 Tax=Deinandra increscens subsp. villosa TaxID=3103831 RepID=A0AAP0GXC9_9ASTR